MRLLSIPVLLCLAACAPAVTQEPLAVTAPADGYDLAAQRAKLAEISIAPDTSFLSAEEREVVNLLIEASGYMSEIYKRQRLPNYDQARATSSPTCSRSGVPRRCRRARDSIRRTSRARSSTPISPRTLRSARR